MAEPIRDRKHSRAAQGSPSVADAVAFDQLGYLRHKAEKRPGSMQCLKLLHRRGVDGFAGCETYHRANPVDRRDSRRVRPVGGFFSSHRDEPIREGIGQRSGPYGQPQ